MVLCTNPLDGWFKLQVDRSYKGNPCPCGKCGILRDEFGNFKPAFLEKFKNETNNEAKLQALISGISMCKTLDIQNIIIETNSELVVGWLKKNHCSAWYLWNFQESLQVELQVISFLINHIFREGNQIADFLTRVGERGSTQLFKNRIALPRQVCSMIQLNKLEPPNQHWQSFLVTGLGNSMFVIWLFFVPRSVYILFLYFYVSMLSFRFYCFSLFSHVGQVG